MDKMTAMKQGMNTMEGARMLPTIEHRGKIYTVDFRLEEIRFVKGHSIEWFPFKDIRDEELKRSLRRLRAQKWPLYYMEGLDD